MARIPTDPLDAGLLLAAAFEGQSIPYALGGALAFGLWAVPRATVDVDVNVFVEGEDLDRVLAVLADAGLELDPHHAKQDNAERGMFVARFGAYRIDVFTPSIEFAWEAMRHRVRKEIDGQPVWFLSAESLAIFKLLFFRPKDIVDLQRLIAVQGERLDTSYIRRHLVELMGEEDERVSKWDELLESST